MDIYVIAAMLLFYGTLIEAKEALRTVGSKIANVRENNPGVVAVVIVDNEPSKQINPSKNYNEPMLPLIEYYKPEDDDKDTSGESNSDEYPNTDTATDSDSESNFYHADDYIKDKIVQKLKLKLDSERNELEVLRNRWKSCQKAQSKVCREACRNSYKNACEQTNCKKKLKKLIRKECKINCKDLFME